MAHIDRLHGEPVIRSLPTGGLDAEHSQWAVDRAAQRETAAREAQVPGRRQREAHQLGPSHPGHIALDKGRGIGR